MNASRKNTSKGSGKEKDYLLTGHGKIPFTVEQMKIMKKRKNSADYAREMFQIKVEQIKQQMMMYDQFIPHEDIKPQMQMDSSMAYDLMLRYENNPKTAESMYQKGKGQIAKPGD